jgi:ATP-dependent Zn protease
MNRGTPHSGGPPDPGRRAATFAEKRVPAASPDPDDPHQLDPLQQARAAIALQWQVLARVATGVAVLTTPLLFLLLYRFIGWGLAVSIVVTILGVFAFRGLVDIVARAFIPTPSGFGENATLKAADITARRRAWFWRYWYRLAAWLVLFYLVAAAIVYVVNAVRGETTVADALRAPLNMVGDQIGTTDKQLQLLGVVLTVVALFAFNAIIFLGPLMYAGIKQIKRFEPGDANWGVKLGDIRGQDNPKEEVRKIVALWEAGDQFERAGGKRERGVLFLGAPGTGKTMLAKAIASGFNCPFVSVPGTAMSQTFVGIDVILVKWMTWRARSLARKWGGQCLIFIDEIDAVAGRRSSLGASVTPYPQSIHNHCFYGPMGAVNPSGDLIVENEAWRERLFRERAPGPGTTYPAPIQRVADRVREFVMPGMGGSGHGALQQLLIEMDGVTQVPALRRFFVNRVNTFLDATYLIPATVAGRSLRLPPVKPTREQLYFIGAANVPWDRLDPAITRPGRMGREVHFRTPDKGGRADIIDLYIGKVAHDPELDTATRREELGRITMGHSPAMIEQVCSLALSYAHGRGQAQLEWQDLLEAIVVVEYGLESGFRFIPEEARAIAVHEAGHAVTGHVFMKDRMSTRLTIKPRGGSGGHHAMREIEERFAHWQHEKFADLVWSLGAMAAERVFYGETGQGVGGDIAGATYDAAFMVGTWGMAPERPDLSGRFPTVAEAEAAERKLMRRYEQVGVRIMNRASSGSALEGDPVAAVLGDPAKRAMVAQLLGQAFLTAYWFVSHNKDATDRVAEVLVEKRELFGNDVIDLLDSVNLTMPDIDVLDEANWPRI